MQEEKGAVDDRTGIAIVERMFASDAMSRSITGMLKVNFGLHVCACKQRKRGEDGCNRIASDSSARRRDPLTAV